MLYAACIPGFLIVVGMQFAVESPRWLAKVTYDLLWGTILLFKVIVYIRKPYLVGWKV